MTRRRLLAALAATAGLFLGGCAAIPVEGPVEEGDAVIDPVEPFGPIVQGPGATDDPAAIVTGFLTASSGGVATDFSVAREFLTPAAAATWEPTARTLVYDSGAVAPQWDAGNHTVTYEVPLAASIDESGRLTDAADETSERIEFGMEQDESGQWRISSLADGVIVSESIFQSFFRQVHLVFATPDLTTVTPELRWLPRSNAATAAARELIEGPSPWLADAVVTGFPATAALAVESVVVADGVATVDLTAQSAGTPEQRALADQQMTLTLGGLPEVTDVAVRIGGLPIAEDDSVILAEAPVPDSTAVALMDGRLGLWDGAELYVVDRAGMTPGDARGVAISDDGGEVAFTQPGVGVLVTTALADGIDSLVPAEGAAPATAAVEASTVIRGRDLVDPRYDRYGDLWTIESEGGDLQVVDKDGEVTRLGGEWLHGRGVEAIALSRDGSRIAVLSRASGSATLEVAAITRDGEGVPTGVGEPIGVGAGAGAGIDIVWTDSTSVAVLGEPIEGAASPLWIASVGGRTSTLVSVPDARGVTARSGESSLVVTSGDGDVDERAGTAWSTVLEGVTDLSYAG